MQTRRLVECRSSRCVADMPSVMERSGTGVLSRSRAKTVTNGNSQPHSEEDSSDEEHAHGTARLAARAASEPARAKKHRQVFRPPSPSSCPRRSPPSSPPPAFPHSPSSPPSTHRASFCFLRSHSGPSCLQPHRSSVGHSGVTPVHFSSVEQDLFNPQPHFFPNLLPLFTPTQARGPFFFILFLLVSSLPVLCP